METIKDLEVLSKFYEPKGQSTDVGTLYSLLFTQGMDRTGAEREFEKLGKSGQQFRNAHSRLMDRMIGGLLSQGFDHYTPAQRVYFNTLKKYIGSEILLNTGKQKQGSVLASNTLTIATKYARLELCLMLSRRLYNYYATIEPNTERRKFYRKKIEHFRNEQNKEIDIEIALNEITNAKRKEEFTSWENYLKTCEKGIYWRSNYYYYKALIIIAYHKNNLLEVSKYCEEGLKFFADQKVLPSAVRFTLYLYQIPALIILQEFGRAEIVINNCVPTHPPGSLNWQLAMYYKCLYGLHSESLKISLSTYRLVKKTKDRSGGKVAKQRFDVIRAYLFLFERLGQIQLNEPRFKLYKFLNSVEEVSKDKEGQNVAIIIVHLLHLLTDIKEARERGNTLLMQRKQKAYMVQTERVKTYIENHLKKVKNARKRTILEMLCKIDHADYYKARTSKRVGKLAKRLKEIPVSVDADGLEAELMPFENTWGIALHLLK